jgi:hypothetical protein
MHYVTLPGFIPLLMLSIIVSSLRDFCFMKDVRCVGNVMTVGLRGNALRLYIVIFCFIRFMNLYITRLEMLLITKVHYLITQAAVILQETPEG